MQPSSPSFCPARTRWPTLTSGAVEHVEVVVGAAGLGAVDRDVVAAAALIAAAGFGDDRVDDRHLVGPGGSEQVLALVAAAGPGPSP